MNSNDDDGGDESCSKSKQMSTDATISPSKSRQKTKISSDQILALLGRSIVQSMQNSTNLQQQQQQKQQIPPAYTKSLSATNETEAIGFMTDGNDISSHAAPVESSTSKTKKKNNLVSSQEVTTNTVNYNDIETMTTTTDAAHVNQ